MSLLFGEIGQPGYVARDIEAAMRHWSGTLGVGPWFYLERMPVTNLRYRGQPSAARFAVALANSGGTQPEPIQPRDDHPSMYRDFPRSGRDGLRHVGT